MNWRLLNTGPDDPYRNMAIDEAIIQLMHSGNLPVLRFYDWLRPAISIGYSQKAEDVLNTKLIERDRIQFVRRPTGGGVVFHGIDITYSVVLPEGIVTDIYDAYRLVQSNICLGISSLGVDVILHEKIEKKDQSGYCFISPNYGDLIIKEKKLGGLAARRIKKKMLLQGYVYSKDSDFMIKYCGRKMLLDKAVSLEMLGQERNKVKEAIIGNWDGKLIKDRLSDDEEKFTEYLLENKYSLEEWNCKR